MWLRNLARARLRAFSARRRATRQTGSAPHPPSVRPATRPTRATVRFSWACRLGWRGRLGTAPLLGEIPGLDAGAVNFEGWSSSKRPLLYTPFFGNHGFLLSGGSFTQIDVPDAAPSPPKGNGLTFANGINNAGQIVGNFQTLDDTPLGFRADPVPEPASLTLLGSGILILGMHHGILQGDGSAPVAEGLNPCIRILAISASSGLRDRGSRAPNPRGWACCRAGDQRRALGVRQPCPGWSGVLSSESNCGPFRPLERCPRGLV